MDEEILRDVFIGIVPAQVLARSLAGAVEARTGVSRYHVADMSKEMAELLARR